MFMPQFQISLALYACPILREIRSVITPGIVLHGPITITNH